MKTYLSLLLLLPTLSACGAAGRLEAVGRAPRFSVPEQVYVPVEERSLANANTGVGGRRPASVGAAVQPPVQVQASSASLFRAGAADLFRDQRAHQLGDILTIRINVQDRAVVDNTTTRSRTGSENASLANLLGIESLLDRILPGSPNAASLVNAGSESETVGAGNTSRSETINLTMSAVVTQVLPNGNLLIRGRQEMRVNNELRELIVTGMIRPQDVARDNSVRHSQIAEARVSYGGRGQLTDVQQARWGQQIYDALFPF